MPYTYCQTSNKELESSYGCKDVNSYLRHKLFVIAKTKVFLTTFDEARLDVARFNVASFDTVRFDEVSLQQNEVRQLE